MRSLRLFLALALLTVLTRPTWGQDPLGSIGSQGSGANLGNVLGNLGRVPTPGTTGAFSQGLGQIVSGWTQDGIKGQELSERIHWLQQARRGDRDDFTSFRDRDDMWRRDRDGRWSRDRDIRQDQRDIRNDRREIRNDENRLARDRADLRHDMADLRRD